MGTCFEAADGSLCFYHTSGSGSGKAGERIPIEAPIDATEQLTAYLKHVQLMGNNFADSFECDICGAQPKYKLNSCNGHGGREVVNLLCSVACEEELQVVREDMNEDDRKHNELLVGQTFPRLSIQQPTISGRGRPRTTPRRLLRQRAERGRLSPEQMDIMGRFALRQREGRRMGRGETKQLHNLRLLRNGGHMPVSMVPVPQPVFTYPQPPLQRQQQQQQTERSRYLDTARRSGISRVQFPGDRSATWLGAPPTTATTGGDLPTDCFAVECPPGMPAGTTCWKCYDLTSEPPSSQGDGGSSSSSSRAPRRLRQQQQPPPLPPQRFPGATPRPPIVFTPIQPRPVAMPRPQPGMVSVMTVSPNASRIWISPNANRALGGRGREFVHQPRPSAESALLDTVTHITLRGEVPISRNSGGVNCAEVSCPSDFDASIKCWKCTDAHGNIVAPPQEDTSSSSSGSFATVVRNALAATTTGRESIFTGL